MSRPRTPAYHYKTISVRLPENLLTFYRTYAETHHWSLNTAILLVLEDVADGIKNAQDTPQTQKRTRKSAEHAA